MTKEDKKLQTEDLQETSRLFRAYSLSSDHFIVVLYLYFLRSLNIEFKVEEKAVGRFLKYEILLLIPKQDYPLIHQINQVILKDLQQWPENSFRALIDLVSNFDFNGKGKNAAEIFEDLIYSHDTNLGKGKSVGILPEGLAEQLLNYLDLPESPKIYNPFAGYASFAPKSYSGENYIGQEINDTAWAIGAMRLIINGYDNNTNFRLEDSISNWIYSENFDLITAFPPFNYKISKEYSEVRYAKTAEEFVLSRGLKNLKSDGKLLCVVSNGFLSRGGADESYRREIVDNNLLYSVFSFPSGLLNNTSIPFSILVIDMNKKSDYIYFHDLEVEINSTRLKESFITRDNNFNNEIIWADVFEDLKTKTTETNIKVGIEEIVENNYILNVPRYFIDTNYLNSLPSSKKLDEIAEVVQGLRINNVKKGKFIRTRDLNDNGVNFTLNLKKVKTSTVPKYAREINESCILLSLRWNKLKPTVFNYSGSSIYISQDLIALKLNLREVDPAFIVTELNENYVIDQFGRLQTGGTHPAINSRDLLKIIIDCPKIEEQRAKVKGVFAAYSKSKAKELELQKELLGYKDEAFREFASIKHTFRQYLNALKSNVSGTKKFVGRQEGSISLDTIYSNNLNRTFGEHLASLEGTIDSMNHLLNSFEENSAINHDEKERNNLIDLIKESQNRFKDPDMFRFDKLYIDVESFIDGAGYRQQPIIIFNKEDFFKVFSNIVSNAKDHGFKNKNSGNIIRCSLSNDFNKKIYVLEISNNGEPFPQSFLYKELITRGEKTSDSKGSGMGGADIKTLLNYYNATFQIVNKSEENFPVTYILKFPYSYDAIL